MRLLIWGLAATALLATEPGKRLQRKAVDTFKELKGRAWGAKAPEGGDQAELEASRIEIKDSIERHPEMGEEENEDDLESPRIKEAEDQETDGEKLVDEEEHGIDQKKAAELLEKLNAKPSAPEDELKSA